MRRQRRLNAIQVAHLMESDEDEIATDEQPTSEEDEIISDFESEESEETSSDEDSRESEAAQTSEDAGSYMLSRNKAVKWYHDPLPSRRARAANVLRQSPGPSRFIQQNCSIPEDIFLQFVTTDMIREIVRHTNEAGRQREAR